MKNKIDLSTKYLNLASRSGIYLFLFYETLLKQLLPVVDFYKTSSTIKRQNNKNKIK